MSGESPTRFFLNKNAGAWGRSSERRFLVDDVASLLGVTIDVAADGVRIAPGARG